jgi:hypothetical protein
VVCNLSAVSMLSLQRTADIAVAPFFIQLIGYDDGIRINLDHRTNARAVLVDLVDAFQITFDDRTGRELTCLHTSL